MRLRDTGISDAKVVAAILVGVVLLISGSALAVEQPKVRGPVFVQLAPISLPVFDGGEVIRQASLVLSLELAKGKSENDIAEKRPILRDAFIGALYAFYDRRHSEDRVIDAEAIKTRLQKAANRVLGPGVVQDVLIQQAFERRRLR